MADVDKPISEATQNAINNLNDSLSTKLNNVKNMITLSYIILD